MPCTESSRTVMQQRRPKSFVPGDRIPLKGEVCFIFANYSDSHIAIYLEARPDNLGRVQSQIVNETGELQRGEN